jgi:hypothetical protein
VQDGADGPVDDGAVEEEAAGAQRAAELERGGEERVEARDEGVTTPACPPAPAASDDEGASDLITGGDDDDLRTSPTVDLETLPPEGRA